MTEQKKSDSAVENAEKTALTDEKSADSVENPAETLSKDELQAISGGTDDICKDSYGCGVIERGAKKAFCNLYII